ncbi:MAG: AmmeMemoRadiSam system protein A [bacterium]|nr:AmmeMemoRadiSam system protein A [bacterium]
MIAFAPLTAQERAFLLRLARATLNGAVGGEPPPRPRAFAEAAGATLSPPLLERRGAFVTLQRHGRLRGCIGDIVGTAPLCEAVIANTLAAAFRDPRFLPLTEDELPGLTLEISALTPLRPVADWSGIEVPRHGVVLTRGNARAVFLPQVAAEQGWDRETLLGQLSLKAGLPPDAWRRGAWFHIFEAEGSGEDPSQD